MDGAVLSKGRRSEPPEGPPSPHIPQREDWPGRRSCDPMELFERAVESAPKPRGAVVRIVLILLFNIFVPCVCILAVSMIITIKQYGSVVFSVCVFSCGCGRPIARLNPFWPEIQILVAIVSNI